MLRRSSLPQRFSPQSSPCRRTPTRPAHAGRHLRPAARALALRPEVVHVVTAPRPGGLYTVAPVLSNGTLLGNGDAHLDAEAPDADGHDRGHRRRHLDTDGVPSGVLIQSGRAQCDDEREALQHRLRRRRDDAYRARRPSTHLAGERPAAGRRRQPAARRARRDALHARRGDTTTPSSPGSAEVVLAELGAACRRRPHRRRHRAAHRRLTPIPPGGAVLVGRGTRPSAWPRRRGRDRGRPSGWS